MELIQDVATVILDLSDISPNNITLLSKKIRDWYFKKNGIWTKLGASKYHPKFYFPDSFYRYPINLCFRKTAYSYHRYKEKYNYVGICDRQKLIQQLKASYDTDPDRLADHLYHNTVFIQYTDILNMLQFPKVKRVYKVGGIFSESLINIISIRNINGCIIDITQNSQIETLERLDPTEYWIRTVYNGLGPSISPLPTKLINRIVESDGFNILSDTVYPNLRKIAVYHDWKLYYGPIENFPKLVKITRQKLELWWGDPGMPGILMSGIYYGRYSSDEWDMVTEKKISLKIKLLHFVEDQDLIERVDKVPIILVYVPVSFGKFQAKTTAKFLEFYRNFGIIIDLKDIYRGNSPEEFNEEHIENIMLSDIDYNNKIVRVKNWTSLKFDVIDYALRLYRKNRLFLDFDILSPTSEINLSLYSELKYTLLGTLF